MTVLVFATDFRRAVPFSGTRSNYARFGKQSLGVSTANIINQRITDTIVLAKPVDFAIAGQQEDPRKPVITPISPRGLPPRWLR